MKLAARHSYWGLSKLPRATDKEALKMRYLLGTLSDEEVVRLEERYFADNETFEELLGPARKPSR